MGIAIIMLYDFGENIGVKQVKLECDSYKIDDDKLFILTGQTATFYNFRRVVRLDISTAMIASPLFPNTEDNNGGENG
jgi:hypothetical protein